MRHKSRYSSTRLRMTRHRLRLEQPVLSEDQAMDGPLNFGLRITDFGLTSRAAASVIENRKSKIQITDASSGSNMVSVGRAVGIRGNHFTHGDGKLDLTGAERGRYSSGCISRYGRKIKHFRRHSSGHIRLVAWGDGELLGSIVAWTGLHRPMGTLFFAERA